MTTCTLAERIDQAIHASPFLGGRRLRFETHGGRVTLHGEVTSYYQKQMAQEAIRRIDGVQEVHNQLEVTWA